MASYSDGIDYFSVGSIAKFQTMHNHEYQGEVISFDSKTKMLVLKCKSTSGNPNLSDVHLLNLDKVAKFEVLKEGNSEAETSPTAIAPPLLEEKLEAAVAEKKKLVAAIKAGVSPDGLRLFTTISKTINENLVEYDEKNIIVFNKVTISPPYRPENVKGVMDSQALILVRKMVEKHWQGSGNQAGIK